MLLSTGPYRFSAWRVYIASHFRKNRFKDTSPRKQGTRANRRTKRLCSNASLVSLELSPVTKEAIISGYISCYKKIGLCQNG